jgi:glycosyltransferase involved in cell wall biosynthesis
MSDNSSAAPQRLSVAFTPVYANPYQHLLTTALGRVGVEVIHHRRLPDTSWLQSNQARVDVLHLHWLYGLYMARLRTPLQATVFLHWLGRAQRLGYCLVWTVHNILPHRRPLPPLHRWIRSVVASRADAIITHCHSARDELLRRFPTKAPVHVIPHGNYVGVYPFDMTRDAARSEIGIESDAFVYLALGNMARYKGLDGLVDEFSRRSQSDERLVIAGRDRDHRLVRRLLDAAASQDRITVRPGFIPDDHMQVYLAAADVLVCPFSEILGSGSLILGMSYGLPVIAPAVGCLPELVTPEAGSLYDPRDPQALGRALDAARSWKLVKMSSAARSIANELRWDRIADQTLDVYKSCLGAR